MRHRSLRGGWGILFLVFTISGVFLAINTVFGLQFFTDVAWTEKTYLYALMGIFLSFAFILFPAYRGAPRDRVPWYDCALFLVNLGVCSYFALNGGTITRSAWEFTAPTVPTVLSIVLWALALEGGRRAGGTAIFILALVLSCYPLYAGYMPGVISGLSIDFLQTARYHAMSVESIVGLPMRVVGTFFIGFLIMGVGLVVTGGGQFFYNLSSAVLGTFRGGPAKVSVVASCFFGSMSGSVVSNVLATGCMTIPAMKRLGFAPHYAAGVEACASTGGVLMPPVMGAVAFLMASLIGVPYIQICIAAAVPSILYYLGLFIQVDGYAARHGIKGLPRQELPSLWRTLKEGWFYIIAMVVLVWLLVYLRREALAPFYATGILLVLANIRKETRLYLPKIREFVVSMGNMLTDIVALLAAIGLIIGSLSVTGMAVTFSSDLVQLAGGNVTLLLIMGAIASLILGTGMTVMACYVFLAITLAPALAAAGCNTMAVHLFLLYWAMISYITPPVAVGSYVAASLAQASPMRTCVEAVRLGGPVYILPFLFVLNPALVLQQVTLTGLLTGLVTTLLGFIFIASGLQGYLIGVGPISGRRFVDWLRQVLIVVGGVLIAWPGIWTTVVGAVLSGSMILSCIITNRRMWRKIPAVSGLQ